MAGVAFFSFHFVCIHLCSSLVSLIIFVVLIWLHARALALALCQPAVAVASCECCGSDQALKLQCNAILPVSIIVCDCCYNDCCTHIQNDCLIVRLENEPARQSESRSKNQMPLYHCEHDSCELCALYTFTIKKNTRAFWSNEEMMEKKFRYFFFLPVHSFSAENLILIKDFLLSFCLTSHSKIDSSFRTMLPLLFERLAEVRVHSLVVSSFPHTHFDLDVGYG